MKRKSIIYLILLVSLTAMFFLFTGGIFDPSPIEAFDPPYIYSLGNTNPIFYYEQSGQPLVIHDKIPFYCEVFNRHYTNTNSCYSENDYFSARDLVGTLEIKQGTTTIVQPSSFIFSSNSLYRGLSGYGSDGLFTDTISLNEPGSYTAIVNFRDSKNPQIVWTTQSMTFTVGLGSETPVSAGTYRLSSFTAQCSAGSKPYTFTNTLASNNLVLNQNGTASLNINMHMGAQVYSQNPCLGDSIYNYNASGTYTISKDLSGKYFQIEYQNNTYITYHFSYDGTNLTLNYSKKDGSSYVMAFVKQTTTS
jgi:hypothetical protein